MRLIDKEKLCGLLAYKALEAQLEDECTELAIKECLSVVRQMPEAVVRCRECKHRKYDDIFGMMWCNLDSCTKRVKPDDFCSYGERKEGTDNV